MTKEIFSPATLPPPVGYSHIAKVNKGTLVYVAGQVSTDASGQIGTQVQDTLVASYAPLAGASYEFWDGSYRVGLAVRGQLIGRFNVVDIVKMNIYLVAEVGQDEVPKMRAIRDRYVNKEKPPASTLVVVTRLARPGWLLEIEAIAALDD